MVGEGVSEERGVVEMGGVAVIGVEYSFRRMRCETCYWGEDAQIS